MNNYHGHGSHHHRRQNANDSLWCKLCNRAFPLSIALLIHRRKEHGHGPGAAVVADKPTLEPPDEIRTKNNVSSRSSMKLSIISDKKETAKSTEEESEYRTAYTTSEDFQLNETSKDVFASFHLQGILVETAEESESASSDPTDMLSSCDDDIDAMSKDGIRSNNMNLNEFDIISAEEDEDIVDDQFSKILTNRSHIAQVVHSEPPEPSMNTNQPPPQSPVTVEYSVFSNNYFTTPAPNQPELLSPPSDEMTLENNVEAIEGETGFDSNREPENEFQNNMDSENQNEDNNIIKVRRDVKLLKCRVEECYRIFTDRLQLIKHSEVAHNVFLCRHCESVMISSLERDSHYVKRHPEHVVFVDPDPQLLFRDKDTINDVVLTDNSNVLIYDQIQSDHNYIIVTPDDTDDQDDPEEEESSCYGMVNGGNLEESGFGSDSPPVLSPVSVETFRRESEEESSDQSESTVTETDSNNLLEEPELMARSYKEAFEMANGTNPIVLLEQIDSATLALVSVDHSSSSGRRNISSYHISGLERPVPRKIKTLTCSVCKGLFTQTLLYLQHRRSCRDKGTLTVSVTPDSRHPPKAIKSSLAISYNSSGLYKTLEAEKLEQQKISRTQQKPVDVSEKARRSSTSSTTALKSFKCSNCSRKFRNENSFRVHLLKDSCKKDIYIPMYKCKLCDQGFSRVVNLQHHVKSAHEFSRSPRVLHRMISDAPPNLECFSAASASSIATASPRVGTNLKDLGNIKSDKYLLLPENQTRKSILESILKPSKEVKASGSHEGNDQLKRHHIPHVSPEVSKAGKIKSYREESRHSTDIRSKSPKPAVKRRSSSSSKKIHDRHHPSSLYPQPNPQKQPKLECSQCGKSFKTVEKLTQHLLEHNEAKVNASNNAATSQRSHMLHQAKTIIKGAAPATSKLAASASATTASGSQRRDSGEIQGTLYQCVICGGRFRKREDMVAHVKSRHSRQGKYACMVCEKKFNFAQDLVFHSQKHEESFKPKRSLSKSQIRPEVALKISTKLEPFRIPKISDSNKLLFPCAGVNCKEIFDSLQLLNKHRAEVHPENKFFLCTQPGCDIPFVHKKGLQRHLRGEHNISTGKEKTSSKTSSGRMSDNASSDSKRI